MYVHVYEYANIMTYGTRVHVVCVNNRTHVCVFIIQGTYVISNDTTRMLRKWRASSLMSLLEM